MKLLAALLVLVGLAFLACGGDSREGTVVTRYELQEGDCYNGSDSPDKILLVKCSSQEANTEVVKTKTVDEPDYLGKDWMSAIGRDFCSGTGANKFLSPDSDSWSLGDRLIVCNDRLGDETSNTSNQDDQSDGNDSSNQGDDTNPRIGTTQASYTLEEGDCYITNDNARNRDDAWYITPCDQAEERVLKVVALKDGPWPGEDGMDRAANDFCPSGTDGYFAAEELSWVLDNRYIVCREYLNGTSSGSGSSVPLYSSDVLDFSKGFVRGSGSQLEAANRELDRVIDSGQQVISCQYGPSDPEAQTGYQSYGFWYEEVPDNIDALLLVARDSGVPDPVFHLGTNSRSSCPDTRDEGEAAWRAGRS